MESTKVINKNKKKPRRETFEPKHTELNMSVKDEYKAVLQKQL